MISIVPILMQEPPRVPAHTNSGDTNAEPANTNDGFETHSLPDQFSVPSNEKTQRTAPDFPDDFVASFLKDSGKPPCLFLSTRNQVNRLPNTRVDNDLFGFYYGRGNVVDGQTLYYRVPRYGVGTSRISRISQEAYTRAQLLLEGVGPTQRIARAVPYGDIRRKISQTLGKEQSPQSSIVVSLDGNHSGHVFAAIVDFCAGKTGDQFIRSETSKEDLKNLARHIQKYNSEHSTPVPLLFVVDQSDPVAAQNILPHLEKWLLDSNLTNACYLICGTGGKEMESNSMRTISLDWGFDPTHIRGSRAYINSLDDRGRSLWPELRKIFLTIAAGNNTVLAFSENSQERRCIYLEKIITRNSLNRYLRIKWREKLSTDPQIAQERNKARSFLKNALDGWNPSMITDDDKPEFLLEPEGRVHSTLVFSKDRLSQKEINQLIAYILAELPERKVSQIEEGMRLFFKEPDKKNFEKDNPNNTIEQPLETAIRDVIYFLENLNEWNTNKTRPLGINFEDFAKLQQNLRLKNNPNALRIAQTELRRLFDIHFYIGRTVQMPALPLSNIISATRILVFSHLQKLSLDEARTFFLNSNGIAVLENLAACELDILRKQASDVLEAIYNDPGPDHIALGIMSKQKIKTQRERQRWIPLLNNYESILKRLALSAKRVQGNKGILIKNILSFIQDLEIFLKTHQLAGKQQQGPKLIKDAKAILNQLAANHTSDGTLP